jgi:hypothetical protein
MTVVPSTLATALSMAAHLAAPVFWIFWQLLTRARRLITVTALTLVACANCGALGQRATESREQNDFRSWRGSINARRSRDRLLASSR